MYIYSTAISDEVKAIDVTLKKILNMDDAIQYVVAKSVGVKAIVSFDKHFNNLDTSRVEPGDLIKC